MDDAGEAIERGRAARAEGDLAAARTHYAEGARLRRESRDVLGYAHAIRHIADMYRQERKLVEAKALYEEALELYRGSLDTKLLDLANAVRPYALLLEEMGEATASSGFWEEAWNLYGSLRVEAGVVECGRHLSRLGRVRGGSSLSSD